jgi:hypothetical protein
MEVEELAHMVEEGNDLKISILKFSLTIFRSGGGYGGRGGYGPYNGGVYGPVYPAYGPRYVNVEVKWTGK